MIMNRVKTTMIAIAMMIFSHGTSHAQRNTVGTSWSLSGIGMTYERITSEDTFAQIAVQVDLGETFIGRAVYPGLCSSFTWNIVFARIESPNAVPVEFFAGPGLAAGMSKDFNGPKGLFLGLKGRAGMQCIFERGVNISISLAPVLGIHMSKIGDSFITRTYRNGILQTILPEIGISYRF